MPQFPPPPLFIASNNNNNSSNNNIYNNPKRAAPLSTNSGNQLSSAQSSLSLNRLQCSPDATKIKNNHHSSLLVPGAPIHSGEETQNGGDSLGAPLSEDDIDGDEEAPAPVASTTRGASSSGGDLAQCSRHAKCLPVAISSSLVSTIGSIGITDNNSTNSFTGNENNDLRVEKNGPNALHCCACSPGYFGNGIECLPVDVPIRLNGAFEGVFNGREVARTDVFAYVQPGEGQQHTAIARIPYQTGWGLLLVEPLAASVMGWLFAKSTDPVLYPNGFQLTGGNFTTTTNIHLGDRYIIVVRHEFFARPSNDPAGGSTVNALVMNIFASGTLPEFSEPPNVLIPPYEQTFRREKPGFIRVYSERDIILSGKDGQELNRYHINIDQSVHFAECQQSNLVDQQTVRFGRLSAQYSDSEQVIRFSSQTSLAVPGSDGEFGTDSPQLSVAPDHHGHQHGGQQHQHGRNHPHRHHHVHVQNNDNPNPNPHHHHHMVGSTSTARSRQPEATVDDPFAHPCASGNHFCDQQLNMRCTPVGQTYRCECERGYQIVQRLNEGKLETVCERTAADNRISNSPQQNHHMPKSDGGFAPPPPPPPGFCTWHSHCHQWGECVFTATTPVTTGAVVSDGAIIPTTTLGQCRCRGWYVGDGFNDCSPPTDPPAHQHQHTGDGNSLSPDGSSFGDVSSSGAIPPSPPPGLTICRLDNDCGENAGCKFHPPSGYYICVCQVGYSGDGVECFPSSSAADPTEQFSDSNLAGQPQQQNQSSIQTVAPLPPSVLDPMPAPLPSPIIDSIPNLTSFTGSTNSKMGRTRVKKPCADQSECHVNAHCVLADHATESAPSSEQFFCTCLPGFEGDGFEHCTRTDCEPTVTDSCAGSPNEQCMFDPLSTKYVCKCVKGFMKLPGGGYCVPGPVPPIVLTPAEGNKHHNHHHPYAIDDPLSVAAPVAEPLPQFAPIPTLVPFVAGEGGGDSRPALLSCLDDKSFCHQFAQCLPDTASQKYRCACNFGYHGDGHFCEIISPKVTDNSAHWETGSTAARLLIGRGMSIVQRLAGSDDLGRQLVIKPHQVVVSIDYDCKTDRIFWSDIAGHVIRSSALNGTDITTGFGEFLRSPEGIAVHWPSRNIYYADSIKNEVGVLSMDGRFQKALVTDGLRNPRALAIDFDSGHLFYSDWTRGGAKIGRVNLDGNNNRVFIGDDVQLPNGMVVLHDRRWLCWVDAGAQKLSCIGLDGRSRRVIHAPLEYPFGLTCYREEHFYWTDWKDFKVHSISIHGTGYSEFSPGAGARGKIYGILSFPPECRRVISGCYIRNSENNEESDNKYNNGECPQLCLATAAGTNDGNFVCRCSDNARDDKHCPFTTAIKKKA